MKIYYGIRDKQINITDICFNKLVNNNIITIPVGDTNRTNLFTDPFYGKVKKIFIVKDDITTEYDDSILIEINTITNTINENEDDNKKLEMIHASLKLSEGRLIDELPEQKMVVRYLTGKEKVLEIGGNIGRNSLVIASILNDPSNLVTLESNPDIGKSLILNKNLNNLNFNIELSALSKRKIIQKDWDTIPFDFLPEGCIQVNTITYEELKAKYKIEFDTLVLDCEGAFYYIIIDMPEILKDINLIIMENDYWDITHKNTIDDILVKNNFKRVYVKGRYWGPCAFNFFEVWKK